MAPRSAPPAGGSAAPTKEPAPPPPPPPAANGSKTVRAATKQAATNPATKHTGKPANAPAPRTGVALRARASVGPATVEVGAKVSKANTSRPVPKSERKAEKSGTENRGNSEKSANKSEKSNKADKDSKADNGSSSSSKSGKDSRGGR